MKKYFSELLIEEPFISVFASGNSITELSQSDIKVIKEGSFLITVNYAPVKITGHMNMWSDIHVTNWLNELYKVKEKDNLFLTRERAIKNINIPIYDKVDYWFNDKKENLKGNYTIVWLLQLLQKYFPDKKVLIFGLDMESVSADRAKWYDDHIDFDKLHRGKSYVIQHKLNQCARQLDTYIGKNSSLINCNLKSQYGGFIKRDWREILN